MPLVLSLNVSLPPLRVVDRQTDRQTDRQGGRQTARQTGRWTDKQAIINIS